MWRVKVYQIQFFFIVKICFIFLILKCYYYIKNMRLFYIFLHFSVKAMKCAPLKQSCCIINPQSLLTIAFKVALAATLYKSTRPKFHLNQPIILGRCNVSLPPAIQFQALHFILADHIIYIKNQIILKWILYLTFL